MLRHAVILLLATTAPAARAQNAPSAIPSGTYDLEITFGGGVLAATLELTVRNDSIAVKLQMSDHDSPVRAGERRGNRLVLESTSTAVRVRYELEFQGDTVSGTFTYDGEPGTLTGRRRPAPSR